VRGYHNYGDPWLEQRYDERHDMASHMISRSRPSTTSRRHEGLCRQAGAGGERRSFCGFTPQYTDLEKLHETYGPKDWCAGRSVNDFGAQEPRTEPEIAKFCETMYGVKFPLTSKQKVIGHDARALSVIAHEAARAPRPSGTFTST